VDQGFTAIGYRVNISLAVELKTVRLQFVLPHKETEKDGVIMGSFPKSMDEYRKQLKRGYIQEAYQGLMDYFRDLKTHFKNQYPDYSVSGSIYYGYMDMTYFSLFPASLKRRKLKIAIVFIHNKFRFEVWLSGSNRNVQTKYWKLVKGSDWHKYHLALNPRAEDYVIDHILIDHPDFGDLGALTRQIERGTLEFIRDVESFLVRQRN